MAANADTSFFFYGIGKEIVEPKPWPDDGGARREAVLDHNHTPARVVRRVGWLSCMSCKRRHFSPDVVKVRLCGICKGYQTASNC